MKIEENVIGAHLESYSLPPLTGSNCSVACQSAEHDFRVNSVCSQVANDFLKNAVDD